MISLWHAKSFNNVVGYKSVTYIEHTIHSCSNSYLSYKFFEDKTFYGFRGFIVSMKILVLKILSCSSYNSLQNFCNSQNFSHKTAKFVLPQKNYPLKILGHMASHMLLLNESSVFKFEVRISPMAKLPHWYTHIRILNNYVYTQACS